MATTTTARDGCVVETAPLAEIMHRFVDNWNRERPSEGGQKDGPISAIEWLAKETGVPSSTLENIARRPPRNQTTELRIADPIVQALGYPFAFHDGTLTVRPNPQAPRSARMSCCGGSLNGSLT
jgi:hypothetical protein